MELHLSPGRPCRVSSEVIWRDGVVRVGGVWATVAGLYWMARGNMGDNIGAIGDYSEL